MTGKWKSRGEKFTLPPRSGPELTDEEIAHEEYLATWCDEDGDEMFPSPRPYPVDYEGMQNGQQVFEDHFAEWQTVEAVRIARAEKNKRRIWETEFLAKRNQLGSINKLGAAQIIGETLQLARSIFDWMRERFLLARNLLGEKHDLTKQIQSDWGVTLTENKKAHELILDDHRQQKQKAVADAQPIWDQGTQAWAKVEARREAHKTGQQVQRGRSWDNGPKM